MQYNKKRASQERLFNVECRYTLLASHQRRRIRILPLTLILILAMSITYLYKSFYSFKDSFARNEMRMCIIVRILKFVNICIKRSPRTSLLDDLFPYLFSRNLGATNIVARVDPATLFCLILMTGYAHIT